ncbi:hypothetical protein Efla_002070 [Eimeria flavescens]
MFPSMGREGPRDTRGPPVKALFLSTTAIVFFVSPALSEALLSIGQSARAAPSELARVSPPQARRVEELAPPGHTAATIPVAVAAAATPRASSKICNRYAFLRSSFTRRPLSRFVTQKCGRTALNSLGTSVFKGVNSDTTSPSKRITTLAAGATTGLEARAASVERICAGVPKVFHRSPAAASGQWVDLYEKLVSERVLFLFSELSSSATENLLAQLIVLDQGRDAQGRMHQPIHLHIHSTGGALTNALALVDLMQVLLHVPFCLLLRLILPFSQLISSPICTINCGLCASSASLVLAGGAPGFRYALEGSRVLLHQPLGSLGGPLRELKIEADGVNRIKEQVESLYR